VQPCTSPMTSKPDQTCLVMLRPSGNERTADPPRNPRS
jgi:hypothetical protein